MKLVRFAHSSVCLAKGMCYSERFLERWRMPKLIKLLSQHCYMRRTTCFVNDSGRRKAEILLDLPLEKIKKRFLNALLYG